MLAGSFLLSCRQLHVYYISESHLTSSDSKSDTLALGRMLVGLDLAVEEEVDPFFDLVTGPMVLSSSRPVEKSTCQSGMMTSPMASSLIVSSSHTLSFRLWLETVSILTSKRNSSSQTGLLLFLTVRVRGGFFSSSNRMTYMLRLYSNILP